MKKQSILTVMSVGALLATPAFAAGSAQQEISTAIEHAGFASQVKSTDKVHLHLHHVVNCLVGPQGSGFYAKAGDPCKGMGNGALNDLMGQSMVRNELESALHEAKTGLNENSFSAAHMTAMKVEKTLKAAKNDYK
ncbi:MAG: hypothetical protein P8Y64_11350 [Gammaproteobacteria bacterium]